MEGQGQDTQMEGQAVAAAAGNDAQRFFAANQAAGYFVHRTVTSHGHDYVGIGLAGQFRGMAGTLGIGNGIRRLKERFQ